LSARYLAYRRIGDDVTAGVAAGALDHPRAHVSYTQLELDEQGFDAVSDLLSATLERLVEIDAEARGRLAGAAPEHRTEAVILHFERSSEGVRPTT
jgi:hypothetical protein